MPAAKPRTARNTVIIVSNGESTTYKPGDLLPPVVDLGDVPTDGPVFQGTDVPVRYVFEYLDKVDNLYTFLKDFPQVSQEQALKAVRQRVSDNITIHSDRQRVSGTPVFKGTRVPVSSLFNYLSYGYSLDCFLDNFPSVEREQAVRTLEMSRGLLESVAYEAAVR